jgi:hypothetical protein
MYQDAKSRCATDSVLSPASGKLLAERKAAAFPALLHRQKERERAYLRQIDSYHRLNLAIRRDCKQKFCLFLLLPEIGDFMRLSEIWANVCARKIGIDSSIQAQGTGEVMSQNWRGYCLFDKNLCISRRW